MNSLVNKKWFVLIGLLLVTLVLVWKAPDPDSNTTETVKAVRPATMQMPDLKVIDAAPETKTNFLAERQLQQDVIDIFNTHQTEMKPAIQQVIALPKPKTVVKAVHLPFKYVGMLEEKAETTVFLMSGTALHLVKRGDEVEEFKLVKIDRDTKQLEWLYLPLKQTHKMSMEQ